MMLAVLFLLVAQQGPTPSPDKPPTFDAPTLREGPVVLPTAPVVNDVEEKAPTSDELMAAPVITELRLSLSTPNPGELERLEGYLKDILLRPATAATVEAVVARLDRLQRYRKPICRTEHIDAGRSVMACSLRRTRVVRQVVVETRDVLSLDGVNTGLPLAILENDLKKRVLLRPGEPLDDEQAGRSRVARQRTRIEDFLDREGYYGAQVRIDAVAVDGDSGDNDVDVVIRVLGGSFVKVHRVNITSFGPLSQERLVEAFGNMCFTGEGLLDGVFIGNITSCFNKRRLQATVDHFTAELHDRGFPEARLRVTPTFVDARSRKPGIDEQCLLGLETVKTLSEEKLPLPPLCVDLDVEVISGNHVVTRFHLKDAKQPLVDDPSWLEGTASFFRETFLEPLGRLWQTTFDNPVETANDTTVIKDALQRRLTFDEAGSVDEAEAKVSLEGVEAYMAERGYPSPDIDLMFQQYESGDVAVDYTIAPGDPVPVVEVRVIGDSSIPEEEIFDEVELAARPRSFYASGFLGKTDLDDDVLRLRSFFGSRGYPEAEVRVHAMRDAMGKVHVVFVVEQGERFLIDRVIFAGGDPAMANDVLAVLAHCQRGLAHVEQRKPKKGTDCKGNPLMPDEMDADARRVEAVYAGHGYPPVESAVELGFGEQGALVRVSVFPHGATGDARSQPKAKNVKRLRMGEIFVEGNIETRREVLLREMGIDDMAPGSKLDPQKISLGVSRLRRTGLYSRVDLELLTATEGVAAAENAGAADDDMGDTAHVRVSVEERPSTTVDLSVGFSTQQLFSLRLEGRNKNLFGTMFDGSASMDLGLFIGRFSQVRTQIRWPRLLGTDLSLSFTPIAVSYKDEPAGIFLSSPSTPAGQKVELAWERPDNRRRLFSLGSSLALDWRATNIHPLIDDKLTIGAAIEARGDWLDISGPYYEPLSTEAFASVDGLLNLLDTTKPVPVIALTPRVAYSNVDNPFDPKAGGAAEVFVRTVPFALAPYLVLGTQARGYLSILEDKITFAGGLRLRWGFVGEARGDGGEKLCPATEPCEWALMQNDLLRLGGERSVRGVAENAIGYTDQVLYDQSLRPSLLGGAPQRGMRPGLFGAVANFEVRFSLIPQLFVGELKPALFTDIGISTDDLNFNTDEAAVATEEGASLITDRRYAFSVGAGLRYVLPVGPLAIDVAYSPFDEATGNVPVRVYVLLGYIF